MMNPPAVGAIGPLSEEPSGEVGIMVCPWNGNVWTSRCVLMGPDGHSNSSFTIVHGLVP